MGGRQDRSKREGFKIAVDELGKMRLVEFDVSGAQRPEGNKDGGGF